MSTTLISVEEYLHTSYRPDCDYVDGEVQERNSGEQQHGLVQSAISAIFWQFRHDWKVRSITELRVRVAAGRVRIPDVCVVSAATPIEPVLTVAPNALR